MKSLFNTIDDIVSLVPWFIAAWCLFGFATMAQAQDLTLGTYRGANHTWRGAWRGRGGYVRRGLCDTGTHQVKAWPNDAKDVCFQKSQFDVGRSASM